MALKAIMYLPIVIAGAVIATVFAKDGAIYDYHLFAGCAMKRPGLQEKSFQLFILVEPLLMGNNGFSFGARGDVLFLG